MAGIGEQTRAESGEGGQRHPGGAHRGTLAVAGIRIGVLAVDLLGVALVLEEFGRVVAAGGAGVVISSMAGQLAQPLTAEQCQALTRTPAPELLKLPFASPQQVTDSGVAYAIAKRANQVRVEAASLAWGQRGATRCAANRGRCCPDAQQTSCRDTGVPWCADVEVQSPLCSPGQVTRLCSGHAMNPSDTSQRVAGSYRSVGRGGCENGAWTTDWNRGARFSGRPAPISPR